MKTQGFFSQKTDFIEVRNLTKNLELNFYIIGFGARVPSAIYLSTITLYATICLSIYLTLSIFTPFLLYSENISNFTKNYKSFNTPPPLFHSCRTLLPPPLRTRSQNSEKIKNTIYIYLNFFLDKSVQRKNVGFNDQLLCSNNIPGLSRLVFKICKKSYFHFYFFLTYCFPLFSFLPFSFAPHSILTFLAVYVFSENRHF